MPALFFTLCFVAIASSIFLVRWRNRAQVVAANLPEPVCVPKELHHLQRVLPFNGVAGAATTVQTSSIANVLFHVAAVAKPLPLAKARGTRRSEQNGRGLTGGGQPVVVTRVQVRVALLF